MGKTVPTKIKKCNASQKGSSFEREICKKLSKWYSKDVLNKESDDMFWRTAGSGARATVRKKAGLKTADSYGDIQAIHQDAKPFTELFLLELKRGYSKDISVLGFVDSKKEQILIKWINKAEEERKGAKRKEVLIIFKRDRHEECILISKKIFDLHFLNCYEFVSINNKYFIIKLDTFLSVISPKSLMKGVKNG